MVLVLLLARKMAFHEHTLALDLGLRCSEIVMGLRLSVAWWLYLLLSVLNLMLLAGVLLLHMPHLLGDGLMTPSISDQLLVIRRALLWIVLKLLIL